MYAHTMFNVHPNQSECVEYFFLFMSEHIDEYVLCTCVQQQQILVYGQSREHLAVGHGCRGWRREQ